MEEWDCCLPSLRAVQTKAEERAKSFAAREEKQSKVRVIKSIL